MRKIYLAIFIFTAFCSKAQDQLTNNGNLTLFSGAELALYGNFANNGVYTDSSQSVTFAGNTSQVISGTATTTFNKLDINNTSGVSLQQNVGIATSLTLTNGILDLNYTTITVNNNSPSAISRVNGFIVSEKTNNSSRIKWKINSTTGSYVFPFGTTSGSYIPFTLKLNSGNIGYVTLSTYPTAVNNTPYPVWPDSVLHVKNASGLDNSLNTVDRFWQIDKDGAGGVADIIFTAAPSEVGTLINLKAQRWNTATKAWDGPIAGQLTAAYSVTVPSVSNFSPWTMSGNGVILPIELVNFNAEKKEESYVNVIWNTESEINCNYFTVEKSTDAIDFEEVAVVNATGGVNIKQSYSLNDNQPYNGISYYRLKETGYNGSIRYHNVVAVTFDRYADDGLSLFPNPCNGNDVTLRVSGIKDENIEINVKDASGRICYSETYGGSPVSAREINLMRKLEPGIYMVSIITKDKNYTKRLIVY